MYGPLIKINTVDLYLTKVTFMEYKWWKSTLKYNIQLLKGLLKKYTVDNNSNSSQKVIFYLKKTLYSFNSFFVVFTGYVIYKIL